MDLDELLPWLRERRDLARQEAAEYTEQGDEAEAGEQTARADTFQEVIGYLTF